MIAIQATKASRHEGTNGGVLTRRAFTVTELLIVIGIIVLVIALAVPAFNVITGSKSIESANNQISAFLARARNEAIGLQEIRGIAFYPDPKQGGRYVVVLVKQPTPLLYTGAAGQSYKIGDYVQYQPA